MTLVVSDTSPLRAIHYLGLLPILDEMFAPIVVPPAVQRELISPPPRFDSIDLAGFPFIVVQSPRDQQQVQLLRQTLDLGESEALALAIEIRADAILVDESAGRRAATQNGVRWLGTLGILLQAKAEGRIGQVRPLVEKLTDELGFFVSDRLKQRVFKLAGE